MSVGLFDACFKYWAGIRRIGPAKPPSVKKASADPTLLQPSHKKTAHMLKETVQHLCNLHGIERVGLLTLTFSDHVTDTKEAQRRYHSLRTNVLSKRYVDFVRVVERQASGRIHYHLVVVLKADIRRGVNFEEFANKTYKSAPVSLRSEWAFWRRNAAAYGFGRTELLPVKSNAEGIGRYVGKYVSKHVNKRLPEDRGARLVSYSAGAKIGSTNFAWNSVRAWLWRAKLRQWALSHGCEDLKAVAALFGPRWAYHHRTAIAARELRFYPTLEHAKADGRCVVGLDPDAINLTFPPSTIWDREGAKWVPGIRRSPCDSSQAARGVVPPEPGELREPGGEGSCSSSPPAGAGQNWQGLGDSEKRCGSEAVSVA
jgi:hypothetical protein